MSNPQLESIADTRRSAELHRIKTERERVDRAIAMNVIGSNGTARSASQTAEITKVAEELDTRAARLRDLTGDYLIAEFASEFLPTAEHR